MTIAARKMLTRTVDQHVAVLTMDSPPVNALAPELLSELEAAFENLVGEETVRAVVLTGTGRYFMAGADVRVLASIQSSREGMDMALRGQAILNKIEAYKKPVLAAINGVCLGAGLELALCCHIRLAADGARLGQPEINLGIMPGFGATQRLPRLIGRSRAVEMILTGDPISAQEAKAVGLVSHVVPAESLVHQAVGLARRIAGKGQVAVRSVLRGILEGEGMELREGLALEARLFGGLCDTQDKKEGLAAFLEKRQPRFTDR
ncbi:MAG: enoyl-CoA hydratase-related protein [Nitrospirales bacterium]